MSKIRERGAAEVFRERFAALPRPVADRRQLRIFNFRVRRRVRLAHETGADNRYF